MGKSTFTKAHFVYTLCCIIAGRYDSFNVTLSSTTKYLTCEETRIMGLIPKSIQIDGNFLVLF